MVITRICRERDYRSELCGLLEFTLDGKTGAILWSMAIQGPTTIRVRLYPGSPGLSIDAPPISDHAKGIAKVLTDRFS